MSKPLSRYSRVAISVLSGEIARGRKERGWTQADLGSRLGVSTPTVSKLERGDPGIALGTAFEAATLVGLPLFTPDRSELVAMGKQTDQILTLLPQRIRKPPEPNDDF